MLSKIRTPLREITIDAFGRGVNCNPNEVGQDNCNVPYQVGQVKNHSIDEHSHATPEVASSMLDINRQFYETSSHANAIEVEQDQSYWIPDPVESHSVDGEQSHITTDVSGTGLKLGMKRKLQEPTSSNKLEKRTKVVQHPDWASYSLGVDMANNESSNQVERETNENRFTCERCNKSFANRYKKQHEQSCSLKYYQCPWCSFQPKSGRPSFVKRHMVSCKAKVANEIREDSSALGDVPAIPNVAPRAAAPSESNMNEVHSAERSLVIDEDYTVPDDIPVISNVAPIVDGAAAPSDPNKRQVGKRAAVPSESNKNEVHSAERLIVMDEDDTVPDDIPAISNVASITDGAAAPSDPNKSQVGVTAANIFPLKCDQCNTSLMLHIQLV